MNSNRALALCLAVLIGLPSLVSMAFACTPVVYAFRHAEDSSQPVPPFPCLRGSDVMCTTSLTPVGKMHAKHYLEMTTNLTTREDFCPVRVVYAVNPINPDGNGGTTNPFATGDPLSLAVADRDPYVTVGDERIDQKLQIVDREWFHAILVSLAKSPTSTALFWTSEGLHDLGEALGTQIIPKKTQTYSPPRNATYIFVYDGDEGFLPPLKADEYVQCFNYASGGRPQDNFENKFWCGYGSNGNLSVPEADFERLHAKICRLDDPDFVKTTTPPNYYGYCK